MDHECYLTLTVDFIIIHTYEKTVLEIDFRFIKNVFLFIP